MTTSVSGRSILRRFLGSTVLMLGYLWMPGWANTGGVTDDVDDATPKVRVAVVSDMNGSYGTVGHRQRVSRAVARIIELKPDLVISTGDMVAGQRPAALSHQRIVAMWQAFHQTVTQPLAAAGIPFAPTPGNHDASAYPAFAAERRSYRVEWRDRVADLNFVDAADYPFNYAFNLMGILFVSLDVTTTGSLPQSSLDWLAGVLDTARPYHRYVVVFSHVPVWPFAQGRVTEATRDRVLHRLLARAGVDLYLSGHHHAFYPGTLDGINFVSQACLGEGPRALLGSQGAAALPGFTLLDFRNGEIAVAALQAPDFKGETDWQTLPQRIGSSGVDLQRADLAEGGVVPLHVAAPVHLEQNL